MGKNCIPNKLKCVIITSNREISSDIRSMNISRILFVFIVFLGTSMTLQGQSEPPKVKKPFKERLVFGGGATVNFYNGQTILGLSPIVGYKVTQRYIAGLGLSYLYISADQYRANNYAASVFNRFSVIEEIFLHAEFEYGTSRITIDRLNGEEKFSVEYPALLVGGGYRQSGGGNIGISFTVLYDILQDRNSPYQQGLIYRGGIFVGF